MSIGQAALLACLLEVSAPKVGNVHRSADFEDTTFYDFVVSASAIQPIFDKADSLTVGALVRQSVQTTHQCVGTNTNLGIVLLLAPLAKCSANHPEADIESVLDKLDTHDRDDIYQAIRWAKPGGMGDVKQADVQDEPNSESSIGIVDAMRLAQDRDTIALQYTNGFKQVLGFVQPTILAAIANCGSLPDAIVHAHLQVMAEIPDTLIARKCGNEVAEKASAVARQILNQNQFGTVDYYSAIEDFDFWLRSDGNRRNPGTSADLIAAGLFLSLRSGQLSNEVIKQALRT